MANPYGLSEKDIADLKLVRQHLPAGDQRIAKIDQLIGAQAPSPQQNMAAQAGALDAFQGENSYGNKLMSNAGQELANAPEGFGRDLWNTGKSLLGVAAPPETAGDYASLVLGPGGVPIKRMVTGYLDATQENIRRSREAANKGEAAKSAIYTGAAALPLVGPLVSDVYESAEQQKGLGVGASRIGQASAMAPKGSPITAPLRGAQNVGGRMIAPLKGAMTEKLPSQMMNYAMGAPPKSLNFGKNPGAEVVSHGIADITSEGLHTKIKSALDSHATELNRVSTSPKANAMRIDIRPAVQVVDDALAKARGRNQPQLIKQLTELRETLTTEMNQGNKRVGGRALRKPVEVLELKRGIQEGVNWSEDNAKPLNSVKKQVQAKLDNQVEAQLPEIRDLNASVSNLIDAERAASGRMNAENVGRYLFRSPELVGGTAVGLAAGGPAGIAAGGVLRAARTTAGLTYGAKALSTAGRAKIPRWAAPLPKAGARLAAPLPKRRDDED